MLVYYNWSKRGSFNSFPNSIVIIVSTLCMSRHPMATLSYYGLYRDDG